MASSSANTTIKEEPTDSPSMEINLDALLDPDDTGIPELNAKRRKPSHAPRPPRPRPGQAPPQKPTYPCPHCPRICTNQWALNRHIASHIDIFKRPEEASAASIPTTTRHCPFCDRAFDLFADLKAHLNQHKTTGNRRLYNCELCSKVFYQPADLIRHQARYHDPSQIYTCKQCPGIIFTDYTAFKRHQRTAHPAVAHYCPACSAVLPDQPNLDAHIYFRHNSTATEITFKKELVSGAGSTVTTRYCCPYCTYRNVQRVPMEVHIYEEHLGEAQKWFVEAMIAVGRRNGATSRGQGRLNSSSGTQVQEPPIESTVVIKEEPADEESDAVPVQSQEARVSESSEMIRSPPPTIKYEPQDEDEISTPTDHNRLPFICKHCHPVLNYFPNQASLTRHLKSAHGQTPIPDGPQIAHHCPLCPAILPALPELKIHIFFSHNPTASRYPIERDLKHPKNTQLWRCPLRCARRDREHFGIQRHVFSKHVEKQQKQIVEQIAVTAKRVTSEGIILPPKPQKPVIVANPLLEQEKPSASTSNTSNTTTKPKNWNERQPTRPVSPCLKRPLATATATDQSVAIPILVPLPTSTSTISKRAIFRAVPPTTTTYQCTQCGNRLPTNHELQVHIWHAHTKQVQRKKQPAPQIIEPIPVTLVVPNELFSVVVSPKQEEEETEDTKEKLAELSRKLFKK